MASTSPSTSAVREHRLGVALVAASAVAWSVSGIFARLLTTDLWTAVCVRSLIGAVYMLIGLVVVHRRRSLAVVHSIGWMGIFFAVCGGFSMVSFVGAFFHTSVANVSVIYATTPFLAAFLGWVVLKETAPWRTLVAAGLALIGVIVMVAGSYGQGHLLGDGLAFMMAATFAVIAVIVRLRPKLEMLPTNMLCCLIAAGIAAPFANLSAISTHDVLVLACFAFTSIPLAFFMFLGGARRIPAAEAGLITTLEVVMSPLWVFLLFNENPGFNAIVGGAIVFGAVVWRIIGEMRGPS